jgi:hypothetical protein
VVEPLASGPFSSEMTRSCMLRAHHGQLKHHFQFCLLVKEKLCPADIVGAFGREPSQEKVGPGGSAPSG